MLRVEFRSLTGPGKPYWKTPLGLTGGMISLRECGREPGRGAGGPVEVGMGVVVGMGALRSFWEAYIAAVVAAPVAALMPAIMARVVFDMLFAGGSGGRTGGWGAPKRPARPLRKTHGEAGRHTDALSA